MILLTSSVCLVLRATLLAVVCASGGVLSPAAIVKEFVEADFEGARVGLADLGPAGRRAPALRLGEGVALGGRPEVDREGTLEVGHPAILTGGG